MLTPGILDFIWVRGSTSPLIVGLKLDNVPIPYDDVRLSVYKGKGRTLAWRISYVDDGSLDGAPGTCKLDSPGVFRFTPTAAQTRALDQTPNDGTIGKNAYEVEVRNGESEVVYLLGVIAAIGGLNDDEEV